MNSKELFDISIKKNKLHSGLPARVAGVLKRGGFNYYNQNTGNFNGDIIKRDIENGFIWGVRGVGIDTVRVLCDWLESEGYLSS